MALSCAMAERSVAKVGSAGADVEQIRVFLGGQFLCHASFGEFRPEIAERFPTYNQADQSGFTFMAQTPREAVETRKT